MNENKNNLLEQFARIQWLLGRYYHHNHRAHGPMGNPYHGQGRVLKLLKMQPEIAQKDLSFLLDMRPQSLGEILVKLEREGYITRKPSEDDKRVMDIHLTEKGFDAANQNEQQSGFGTLFNCLSDDEQLNLSAYLNRIIEELDKQFCDDLEGAGRRRHGKHRFKSEY